MASPDAVMKGISSGSETQAAEAAASLSAR